MEDLLSMSTESMQQFLVTKQPQPQAQHAGPAELVFFQSGPGKLIHTLIYYLGCPVMMLVAISTNLINVAVFLRGGLRDGMAINFLGLTISDLLYNMFYFMGRLLNAVQSVFDESPYLNTRHLSFIFAKYGRMWFNVSILLTVFAAIQKLDFFSLDPFNKDGPSYITLIQFDDICLWWIK
ncbi:hypothetical protein ElyMa_001152300 [Elysia marginata]|uniref:G-protein coupled receptors family 1 profile domain-containing protein n=1 Tax=Elysia marginata TaxID=1093978 RepID=A0AAV4I0M9_9GAST|nr:hypothetical protein ElyMa_001152300 [Elysia marginata]